MPFTIPELAIPERMRCRVCGFSEVVTDEAVDRALVYLGECPRCEHRWTSSRPPGGDRSVPVAARPLRAFRVTRESAPAA